MSDLEQRNARSVVKIWDSGDHLHAWGPAAHNKPPSKINQAAADASRCLQLAADNLADDLLKQGFLPGHEVIRGLRGTASQYAQRANRLYQWADHLKSAEDEER